MTSKYATISTRKSILANTFIESASLADLIANLDSTAPKGKKQIHIFFLKQNTKKK